MYYMKAKIFSKTLQDLHYMTLIRSKRMRKLYCICYFYMLQTTQADILCTGCQGDKVLVIVCLVHEKLCQRGVYSVHVTTMHAKSNPKISHQISSQVRKFVLTITLTFIAVSIEHITHFNAHIENCKLLITHRCPQKFSRGGRQNHQHLKKSTPFRRAVQNFDHFRRANKRTKIFAMF